MRAGIGEHGTPDTLRRVRQKPLADHAAFRESDPMHLIELERIHDGERIASELFDRIRSIRRAAFAVAARIVADDAKVLRQFGDLRIPHMQIGAERVRQHQRRRVLRPVERNVELDPVPFELRHVLPPPRIRLLLVRSSTREAH
jgi:hypothetical protein